MSSSSGNFITAGSFSQPTQTLGTLTVPVAIAPIITIPYVAGFTKYVLYSAGALSTVGINQTFQILQAPVNLVATTTISNSVDWVLSGSPPIIGAGNFPILVTTLSVINNTLGSTTVNLNVSSTASPTYTGTAVLKMVLNLTQDL